MNQFLKCHSLESLLGPEQVHTPPPLALLMGTERISCTGFESTVKIRYRNTMILIHLYHLYQIETVSSNEILYFCY